MVSTSTFISDTVIFIRNDLRTNITDPLSSSRPANEKHVLTSYPQRAVRYRIITVRSSGPEDIQKLGMRSELRFTRIPLEIRIWARNEIERDELTQQVINRLRSNQFGASSSSDTEDLHDFSLLSATPVDELGQEGVKSMVLNITYSFVLGA